MDVNWNSQFDPGLNRLLVQRFTALRHVSHRLAESVMTRPAGLLSVITLPGVYSVIVPPPSVVVVVVVVLEVCPHANGATTASAMLNNVFFILIPFPFLDSLCAIARRLPLNQEGGARFSMIRMSEFIRVPANGFWQSHLGENETTVRGRCREI